VVDQNSPTFRVIFTNFENPEYDLVMLPISTQIYTPGFGLTITEANFNQIESEDAFNTTVSYFYDLQERATTWKEGDCQYFKASDVWDDTDEFFRIGNCKNGSSLFYYGSNSARPFNAGEVLTEVMKNGTKVTYFADAAPIRKDPEL
jgi:hypothetical protein